MRIRNSNIFNVKQVRNDVISSALQYKVCKFQNMLIKLR